MLYITYVQSITRFVHRVKEASKARNLSVSLAASAGPATGSQVFRNRQDLTRGDSCMPLCVPAPRGGGGVRRGCVVVRRSHLPRIVVMFDWILSEKSSDSSRDQTEEMAEPRGRVSRISRDGGPAKPRELLPLFRRRSSISPEPRTRLDSRSVPEASLRQQRHPCSLPSRQPHLRGHLTSTPLSQKTGTPGSRSYGSSSQGTLAQCGDGIATELESCRAHSSRVTEICVLLQVKCPQNSARTWEISAHGEPAFCRYRCVGRQSSDGRSRRKVGPFGSILRALNFSGSLGLNCGKFGLQTR